jgi:hypothetical protein
MTITEQRAATSIAERLASVPNLVRSLMDPITAYARTMREIEEQQLLRLVAVRPIEEYAPDAAERARRRLAQLPDWPALRGWARSLDDALTEAADDERTRVLVAMMVDGLTKRIPSLEMYLDAASVLLVDAGLGPGIVAGACKGIWSRRKSPPSVAEVLAEAQALRAEISNARGLVQRALAARQKLEAIAGAARALPPARSISGGSDAI